MKVKVYIDKIAEQALKICDKYGINHPSHREAFAEGYRYGAEWKDNQFKEYLDKKNTEISNAKTRLDKDDAEYMLCTLKSLFIDEIINELFKKD